MMGAPCPCRGAGAGAHTEAYSPVGPPQQELPDPQGRQPPPRLRGLVCGAQREGVRAAPGLASCRACVRVCHPGMGLAQQ